MCHPRSPFRKETLNSSRVSWGSPAVRDFHNLENSSSCHAFPRKCTDDASQSMMGVLESGYFCTVFALEFPIWRADAFTELPWSPSLFLPSLYSLLPSFHGFQTHIMAWRASHLLLILSQAWPPIKLLHFSTCLGVSFLKNPMNA